MDDKKRIYTQSDFNEYAQSLKTEYEQMLARQKERINELRKSLADAEKKIAKNESQKELVYKAITAALKKADDIERVSLIKYNQEIAQLKRFHDKWMGYYNRIIEAYPLDDDLIATSKVNAKIGDVLGKADGIDKQYEAERERLMSSLNEDEEAATERDPSDDDDYAADRSPAGFSFAEALHPKDDLKDIMRELGVLIDD